jgi:hypothetical protein
LKLVSVSSILFVASLFILGAATLFEFALRGVSLSTERALTFLLLVLPAGTGAVLAILSLIRKEGRAWLAVILTLLNAGFALFHLLIVLFAG